MLKSAKPFSHNNENIHTHKDTSGIRELPVFDMTLYFASKKLNFTFTMTTPTIGKRKNISLASYIEYCSARRY